MRFALGFLILAPAFGQSFQSDAAALLARQADELQRYHSYQFTQDMTTDIKMPGTSMPSFTTTSVVQAVNPGKIRMASKSMGMDTSLMVSDGKQTWTYMPFTKQYIKTPVEDGAASFGEILSGIGITAQSDMKELTENAKVVRSELLEVDGQQHDCWVVESGSGNVAVPVPAGASMQDMVLTTWIDKTLGIQLKMSISGKMKADAATPSVEMHMVTTTHSLKFNEDLPNSLFEFTPPEGAKENPQMFASLGAITGAGGLAGGRAGSGAMSGATPAAPSKALPKPAAPGEPEAYVPGLQPIEHVEPVYPAEARAQGLQGNVRVLVTLDSTGAVVNAEALSGREILRPAALDAVKRQSYRPILRDGRPVPAYTDAGVVFFLDNGPDPVALDPAALLASSLKDGLKDNLGFDIGEEMQADQRIAELTDRFPRSFEQVLADSEEQKRGVSGLARFYALPDLAKEALDAGALAKASSYATELLQTAGEKKDDFDYGGAIYKANMILGLVALRQGSVSQARQYLLESAKSPGSLGIESFGPDLTLARELLARGERDAVLEFLTLCKGFWKSGAERLDSMAESVRSGGTL